MNIKKITACGLAASILVASTPYSTIYTTVLAKEKSKYSEEIKNIKTKEDLQKSAQKAKAEGVIDTWITGLSNMPTSRYILSSAVVDGKIYIFGGDGTSGVTSKVEAYNPKTDTWETKANMPTPRNRLTSAVVDGKIYVIGGLGGTAKEVEVYNPATDTWEKKANIPTARNSSTSAVVDGKIYVIGGNKGDAGLKDVEVYNPATDTWEKKADMPTPRYGLASSVVDGKIYVIGGKSSSYLTKVEVYDPATDTWETKADMPTSRYGLTSTVVDGKIYVIGGFNGTALNVVEAYTPTADTWEKKTDMPTSRYTFASEVVDGKIYCIGGYGKSNNEVEAYIAKTNHKTKPVLSLIKSKELEKGQEFNPLECINATDEIDGDITSRVTFEGTPDTSKYGQFIIKYKVQNLGGLESELNVTFTVVNPYKKLPIIKTTQKNRFYNVGDEITLDGYVTAVDEIDGDLTDRISIKEVVSSYPNGETEPTVPEKNNLKLNEAYIKNPRTTIDSSKEGTHKVIYEVTNGGDLIATRAVTIKVSEPKWVNPPEIIAAQDNIKISKDKPFDPLDYVVAIDEIDGDITSKIEVESDVDERTLGTYQVLYTVANEGGLTSQKTLNFEVEDVLRESQDIVVNITTEEFLTLTLSENEISFADGYNGLEDLEFNIDATVTSSAPYELSATMPKHIVSTNGHFMNADTFEVKAGPIAPPSGDIITKSITDKFRYLESGKSQYLNDNKELREVVDPGTTEGDSTTGDSSTGSTSGDYTSDYKSFRVGEKIILVDNAPLGTDMKHQLDFKIKNNVGQRADDYKALIKIEAQQK